MIVVISVLLLCMLSVSSWLGEKQVRRLQQLPRLLEVNSDVEFMSEKVNASEWRRRLLSIHELNSHGKWVDAWAHDPDFQPMYSVACHRIYKYSYEYCSQSSPNVGLQYTWKSSNQQNYRWNAPHMCKMMNGRNVLIVGDSLNEEFFFALYSSMTAHVIPFENMTAEQIFSVKDRMFEDCKHAYCELLTPNCDKTLTMQCGSAAPPFTITLVTTFVFYEMAREYFQKYGTTPIVGEILDNDDYMNWITKIQLLNISLIMINQGAHYKPLKETIDAHKEVFTKLFQMHPNVSVIYRNTVPGHLDCGDVMNAPPLKTPQNLVPPHNDYHWEDFNNINIALHYMLRTTFPQIVFLDVATSGVLRADSHVSNDDCLHYCTPGPVDNWVLLFYQTLILATNMLPSAYPLSTKMEQLIAKEKNMVPSKIQMILPPDQRDPRGDLLMHKKGSNYVFLMVKGTKRPFNSGEALMSMGREFSEIKKVDTKDLCDIPTGPLIF